MRPTTRFRRLVEAPEILVLPGVQDALTARIAERAGFAAHLVAAMRRPPRCSGGPTPRSSGSWRWPSTMPGSPKL
ncbi:MAG: hypothetical protein R3D25_17030 [Geminicoccaceae bacterium]